LRSDLSDMLRNDRPFRSYVETVISGINGDPYVPASFRRLHQLLQA
jgi:hypothetical protein